MFEQLMKEIQKYNSKANWANVAAGLVLLLVLAGGSLWYFTRGKDNGVKTNQNVETTKDTTATTTTDDANGNVNGDSSVNVYTQPQVKVLPYTSSK